MEKGNKRTITFIICSIFVLIIGMFLAISLGTSHIGISEIWHSIFNYNEKLDIVLIRDVRIPRALSVLLTGGILGVTGAMIQGVTRNPIAEPSLLGVSQGATLVVAIFYAAEVSINTTNVMIASLIGAVFSGIIVIGFMSRKANNTSITKILLAGTAMSTFFISLTTIVGLLSNKSQLIAFWVAGGFRNATWADTKLVAIVGILGLIIAILLSKKINILSLGDDVAISLGENPERIRLWALLVMIPMCAAAVAVGKNIGFVGLIVPQIVRKVLGEDYRKVIPSSFLLGAVLLTFSDIAARMVYNPYETPIGVFTALIGVPFFITVARKEKG
ncbi:MULTISPECIES: FecCD family ABC transporter permease [Clostridium]|mgnify:CR=1 FL=1|jgi:iron complex transport system permease protein|uniref:Iron-uptake system permease protein FeuB n=2 Tax=Clostridium TaxID=1485 RepID=A0A151APB7_9CLOT|nr:MULTISPECIES: iron ABC transporter permease [Clostridium]KYH29476.1 iron-uptake system permease protein FeuB [Clostridium colicanis DSM 13634]MBE6042773.1 iron ABC transporter permease [Clostridium thermopalmarium]PRR70757.1 Iron-uptake system permease protein FeuB [Clostridium thermopalmarium DSM 5974]PVZ22561.1 iron complex transport system permease protein [Clostridium thermopalmarium DSM 5974]